MTYGYGTPAPAPAPAYAPMPPPVRNGVGRAALAFGVLSLITVFAGVSFWLSVVAITCGVVGLQRAKKGTASNSGVALSGLILGAVAILGSVVLRLAWQFLS